MLAPQPSPGSTEAPRADSVLVIAHRGASGVRPEHTHEAYALAAEMGADFIEPDVVSTKDGVLVVRHENEISETTDVAVRPEFASRRTTKTIDGAEVTGWFTEDFMLDELKTLRAVERLPSLRPKSARYDRRYEIPTLAEVVALAERLSGERGRPVGIYPETKHPTYFREIGLPLEEPLLTILEATDVPVYIQSFEVENLQRLRGMTDLPLVQLAYPGGRPYDRLAAGDPTTYDDLLTPDGLADVARYADAVGVEKRAIYPITDADSLGASTSLAADAHAIGLGVHVWTVRAENAFLPLALRSDGPGDLRPAAVGDVAAEVRAFVAAGVDGLFTDHPDRVLDALGRRQA